MRLYRFAVDFKEPYGSTVFAPIACTRKRWATRVYHQCLVPVTDHFLVSVAKDHYVHRFAKFALQNGFRVAEIQFQVGAVRTGRNLEAGPLNVVNLADRNVFNLNDSG